MSVNVELNNDDADPKLIYGIFILPLISDTNLLSTLHICSNSFQLQSWLADVVSCI